MGEQKAGAGGSAGAFVKRVLRSAERWLAKGARRRFVMLGGSVVLVVASLSLVTVNLIDTNPKRLGHPGPGADVVGGAVPRTKTDAIDEDVTKQVYAARAERRYDDAVMTLETYAAAAGDEKQKAYAFSQIGAVYEVQGDNAKALEAYRRAEEARGGVKDVGIAMGIARTSESLGDTATTIKYYQIYVDLLKADNDEMAQLDIERIEAKLVTLKSSGVQQ